MPNMQPKKTPAREQDPAARARNFDEVTFAYTPGQAQNEALRCLHCKPRPAWPAVRSTSKSPSL